MGSERGKQFFSLVLLVVYYLSLFTNATLYMYNSDHLEVQFFPSNDSTQIRLLSWLNMFTSFIWYNELIFQYLSIQMSYTKCIQPQKKDTYMPITCKISYAYIWGTLEQDNAGGSIYSILVEMLVSRRYLKKMFELIL